jgi:hypothetical protein
LALPAFLKNMVVTDFEAMLEKLVDRNADNDVIAALKGLLQRQNDLLQRYVEKDLKATFEEFVLQKL